jgi:hypothetical protein
MSAACNFYKLLTFITRAKGRLDLLTLQSLGQRGGLTLLTLQSWQPHFNLVVAVYHPGIEDFKSASTARLITIYLLRINTLVQNKCNTQSAGPCACTSAMCNQ